jgi:hypothetical protein
VGSRGEETLRHACMHLHQRYGQIPISLFVPPCPRHTCVYAPESASACRACKWDKLSINEPKPKRG